MATPVIDERLLYPDSIPELAEDLNRIMAYIDALAPATTTELFIVWQDEVTTYVPDFPIGGIVGSEAAEQYYTDACEEAGVEPRDFAGIDHFEVLGETIDIDEYEVNGQTDITAVWKE